MRDIRYRTIADALRARIVDGELPPGTVLPSEAELAGAYGASRVTVRRALDLLRTEGLVESRQGYGWFVPGEPLRQSLAELGTIEGQLAQQGRTSERRILSFGFAPAPARVAAVLGGGEVLEVSRLNLSDGRPFALVTVWCREALGASLSRDDVERSTFYDLLDVQWGSAVQTIGAGLADGPTARHLDVPEGSPLLLCERVSSDRSGRHVLVSEHRFPAHLTEFVVELPHVDRSMSPSGLRLLDDARRRTIRP